MKFERNVRTKIEEDRSEQKIRERIEEKHTNAKPAG